MIVTSMAVPGTLTALCLLSFIGAHLNCHRLAIDSNNFDAMLAHAWSITKGMILAIMSNAD